MTRSIGPDLREQWRRACAIPWGKWLFSRLLRLRVPYTGSLGAVVVSLEPGYCEVKLHDTHRLRNHLHSIHAMALANLGEMVTGLALVNGLPNHTRAILTGFSIDYLKKARGTLLAQSRCSLPVNNDPDDLDVEGEIRDGDGSVVATVRARWRIGPVPAA
jgi:acyl-coenzyme A thioesterase PaaI-like protein